jgi:hypothetical protein
VFAKVELDPETDCGSLLRLEAKPPPALVESAARESDATAPAPSLSIESASYFAQRVPPGAEGHKYAQGGMRKGFKGT